MSWLIHSRLCGRLSLPDGGALVTHLLARTQVLCSSQALALLARFRIPTRLDDVRTCPGLSPAEVEECVESMIASLLLRSAGSGEAERVRHLYSQSLEEPPPAAEFDFAAPCDPAMTPVASSLTLSTSLTALKLDDETLLVTHPLGAPLHLRRELWDLALRFRVGASVSGVTNTSGEATACEFLRKRLLLWRSSEEELAVAAQLPSLGSRRILTLYPTGNRWRQRYRPYGLREASHVLLSKRVALIGPCQVQLVAEALEYLGRCAGLDIETHSLLEVSSVLSAVPLTAIICSAVPYSASFYDAAACADWQRLRAAVPDIVARTDDLITRIRAKSSAPVLVVNLARPGFATTAPYAAFHHEFVAQLAEVNQRLARCAASKRDVWLLDQEMLVQGFAGAYWDDAFTAMPHHSAISSWSWVALKAGVTDDAFDRTRAAAALPPRDPWQRDPAEPLAFVIIRFLKELQGSKVRLIVFEPDGLLWSGLIADRTEPLIVPPSYYADIEEYVHSGIHEALSVMRRRGVLLAALSECPPTLLHELWKIASPQRNVVRREDLAAVDGGPGDYALATGLARITATTGVPAEETLWMNLHKPPPSGFRGRVFTGSAWDVRRLLLHDPALEFTDSSDRGESAPAQTMSASSLPARGPHEVQKRLFPAIAAHLKCSLTLVNDCSDLRFVGLDSVGAVALMANLERLFEIEFEDADFTEPVTFQVSALTDAIVRALRRSAAGNGSAASIEAVVPGGWQDGDLALLLRRRLESPTRPWLFKFVRSANAGDYRHLSARELLELAIGHAGRLDRNGVGEGDRVVLALTGGIELLSAIVGTIFLRAVPMAVAPPGSSDAALARWLSQWLEGSGAQCVVADELLAARLTTTAGHVRVVVATSPCGKTTWRGWHGSAQPETPALLIASSGTTATTKIGFHSHRSVLSRLEELGTALAIGRADALVSWMPMQHTIGLVNGVLFPLLWDIPATLIAPEIFAHRPAAFLRELASGAISFMPNFAFLHCARHVSERQLAGLDFSGVRAVVSAGEPVSAFALDAFHEKLAPFGFRRAALSAGYGMAETAGAITQSDPGGEPRRLHAQLSQFTCDGLVVEARGDDGRPTATLVSCGAILPSMQVRIRLADGVLAPDLRVGAIEVRGPSLMTECGGGAEAQTPDGFLRTGDLGFTYADELFVTGREKELIIVAGRNISPAAVEEAAGQALANRAVAVFAFGSRDEATGTEQLQVFVELLEPIAPGQRESAARQIREAVLAYCDASIYAVHFSSNATLERTASGKVLRARSRERVIAAIEELSA